MGLLQILSALTSLALIGGVFVAIPQLRGLRTRMDRSITELSRAARRSPT